MFVKNIEAKEAMLLSVLAAYRNSVSNKTIIILFLVFSHWHIQNRGRKTFDNCGFYAYCMYQHIRGYVVSVIGKIVGYKPVAA
jgi:hypothetical protein